MSSLVLKNAKIELTPDTSSLPASSVSLYRDLDAIEAEMKAMTAEFNKVDAAIDSYTQSFEAATDGLVKFGMQMADKAGRGDSSRKAKGILALIGIALKGIGAATSDKKRKEALERFESQVKALMGRKISIAQTKLPVIRRELNKFSAGPAVSIQRLYDNAFTEKIDLSDRNRAARISLFCSMLCLKIKSDYMQSCLNYYSECLDAWVKGEDGPSGPRPSVARELEKELDSWPRKTGGHPGWRSMIMSELRKKNGVVAVPVATVLSNACLFKNFIGVNFGEVRNAPDACIDITQDLSWIQNPLALENPYLKRCIQVFKTSYSPPAKPRVWYTVLDWLRKILVPAIFIGIVILIFHWEKATFWRIFWLIPTGCWASVIIEKRKNRLDNQVTYAEMDRERYRQEIKDLGNRLRKAVDMPQIHTLK